MTERRVLCTLRTMSGALLLTIGLMAMPAMGDHPECGAAAGDCCEDNGDGSPGCEDADCCHAVCDADPFCCDTTWDGICAGLATDLCGGLCAGGETNCADEGDTQLSQSTDLLIDGVSGVACAYQGTPFTADNQYARSYVMKSDLGITCVGFGLETNTQSVEFPAEINIYRDTDGGPPGSPGADLQLIGTAAITVAPDAALTILYGNYDPPVDVAAGETIVVVLAFADANNISGFWPGANGLGQSGTSYLFSIACGLDSFIDYADINFPDVHLVNTINGNAGGPPCVGDLDGNGTVNTVDLLILFAAWGPNPGDPADLDGNGTVNTVDLLILFANWGPC